jgi:hypothetical protein
MAKRVSSGMRYRSIFWAAMLALPAAGQARPVIIENLSSFGTPDPAYTDFGGDVAIDGVNAVVLATHPIAGGDNPLRPYRAQTAFLFHLSGTTWKPVRRLNEYQIHPDFQFPLGVAMRGGIVAAQIGRMDIWERGTTSAGTVGWVRRASLPADENPGPYVDIDGTRVINGQGACEWNGQIYEKDSTGAWVVGPLLLGKRRADGCDDSFHGESVAIRGPWSIVQQRKPEDESTASTLIFRQSPDGWTPYSDALPEEGITTFGPEVTVLGDDVIVGGSDVTGTLIYREEGLQGFHLADRVRTLDSYMGAGHALQFARDGDLLLQRSQSFDRDACVVHVFKRRTDGSYEHVATLVGKNGQSLTGAISISGRRVLVSDTSGQVHFFELPAKFTAPAPRQDTFVNGSLARWSPSAGSTFTTMGSGQARMLRQSQTAVFARATYDDVDWTNEAIEADVRIRQIGGAGSGVGLTTRFQGEDTNYFEAFMCGGGRLILRRKASGVLRTLASTSFRPVVNRTYRLRLESIGTQHRIYIDGELMLDVDAGGATHGRPAIFTDHAAADFDNVVLTPSPRTTMYATDFEATKVGPWTKTGTGLWTLWSGESQVWFQSSIAGDARATIGAPADDQVVGVRARLDTFASPNGTQERWFGVMARHSDSRNYYYLSLRSSNTLSLRKLVDGHATTLATTTFTVTPATWYDLRLEAIGNQIRAYVNGTLRLEATDDTHTRGTSGPVMYKTAADFDDFYAYQP